MKCHEHESRVFRVFYPFLIWLWVCFAKSAMFCCEFWWVSIEKRRPLNIPDANFFGKKTVFHVIITSTLLFYPLCYSLLTFCKKIVIFSFLFLFIFPLFAVSSNKQILLRIYLEYLGKKKQQQQTNQQNKTKAANSVYFSSITSRITLQLSIYLCLSYI